MDTSQIKKLENKIRHRKDQVLRIQTEIDELEDALASLRQAAKEEADDE